MSRENLVDLLSRMSERLGVDLHLDEHDYCLLHLDNAFDVSLEYKSAVDSLVLTADCGELPTENREAAMQQLLDANFMWSESGGGTLSTKSSTGTVHLHFRENTNLLDEDRLHLQLQAMVNNAEVWRKRLAYIAKAGTDEANPGDTSEGAELTPQEELLEYSKGNIILI